MALGRSADDGCHASVWRLEEGFFARDAQLAVARQVHDFSTRVVPNIDETTQFFRMRVDVPTSPSLSGEIWVIFLHAPGDSAAQQTQGSEVHPRLVELRLRLLTVLPDARLCFVTRDREGYARIANPEVKPVAFAAAVAVVKYYASWDESDPILIATGDDQVAVSVDFTSDHYLATVCHA